MVDRKQTMVAIYCRLSEEDRNKHNENDDSLSIQNQKAMLIQYAQQNQWEIYQIYSDDDYKGSDRNRPEFNRLLADAQAGKFGIILCKSQSRFTRELELVEKYINGLFLVWGIRFVSVVDNADTDNKGNKKSRQINGLVNEWYLEDMSESIKSALTIRRQNGFHIGAFALYGYQKDPDKKGHLIPDPEAAAVVRRVFQMFAAGIGKTAIARILNEEGILNPTAYKIEKGIREKVNGKSAGKLWKYYTIQDMLVNEMYIGNMVQGKYGSISYKSGINKPRDKELWIRVENTHEPIVERELWDEVQRSIKEKQKPFLTGEIGIFSRRLKCMYCGYNLRTKKSHGYRYFACGTNYFSKETCIGASIPEKELEEAIREELNRLCHELFDEASVESMLERQENQINKQQELQQNIKKLEKKVEKIKTATNRLYMDRVEEIVTEEEFSDMMQSFREDIRKAREQEEKMLERLKELEESEKGEETKKEILSRYIDENRIEINRELVTNLIDYIEIGRRPSRNENVPIVIHWNF